MVTDICIVLAESKAYAAYKGASTLLGFFRQRAYIKGSFELDGMLFFTKFICRC